MSVAILLAAAALRAGLALRRARRGGARRRAGELRRHLRLARPAVALVLIGFLAGPISAVWLRGWAPFRTAHAALAVLAAALFATAGLLGHRLAHGRGGSPDRHGLVGLLAVLAAVAAFGTGFVLLP
jgi:hypothetical protein